MKVPNALWDFKPVKQGFIRKNSDFHLLSEDIYYVCLLHYIYLNAFLLFKLITQYINSTLIKTSYFKL